MKIIKPPTLVDLREIVRPVVFLGGSIEMGAAEDWQVKVENFLKDRVGTIFNPRRDDWDSSWKQDPTPGTKFFNQVNWELNSQDHSDIIIYWFDSKTKSPITLLELGLYAQSANQTVIVHCPKDFWRYGNVKVVCDRYDLLCWEDEFFESLNYNVYRFGNQH